MNVNRDWEIGTMWFSLLGTTYFSERNCELQKRRKKKKKRAGIPTGKDNISLVDFERWSKT